MKFKQTINKNYFAIVTVFCLYYLQGIAYPSGSFISQLLAFLLLFIGMLALVKIFVLGYKIPLFIKVMATFFTLIAITYILSPKIVRSEFGDLPTMDQFKTTCLCCLPLFIGFSIGYKHKVSDKQLFYTFIVLLLLCILRYNYRITLVMDQLNTRSENVTNNEAYNFVTILLFLPIVFSVNKKVAIISFLLCLSFILAGVKRGAIVCTLIMTTYALFHFFKQGKLTFSKVLFIALFSISIYAYFIYTLENNDFLNRRIERAFDGDSSNRDVIAEDILNSFSRFDIFNSFFGQGSAQTLYFCGTYAHNDWLELLIDNGILGVGIYAIFFISFFNYGRKRAKGKVQLSLMLFAIFALCKSAFSMAYSSAFLGIGFLTVGVLVGNNEKGKLIYKKLRNETNNKINS